MGPSIFYDQVQDLDDLGKVVGVEREGSDKPDVESLAGSDVGDGRSDDTFGLTAERKNSEPPVFNTKLGSYQRPMSAHGVRNKQEKKILTQEYYGQKLQLTQKLFKDFFPSFFH